MGKSKLSDEEIRKRAYGKDPDSLSEKLRKNAAKIVMAVITIAMISTMILGYAATFMQGARHSEQLQGIQVQVFAGGGRGVPLPPRRQWRPLPAGTAALSGALRRERNPPRRARA